MEPTLKDLLEHAMSVQTEAEADACLAALVDNRKRVLGETDEDAVETNIRASVAYYAGYFDNETRERVERLFNAEHPWFGSIAKYGPPSPGEALALGEARAINDFRTVARISRGIGERAKR